MMAIGMVGRYRLDTARAVLTVLVFGLTRVVFVMRMLVSRVACVTALFATFPLWPTVVVLVMVAMVAMRRPSPVDRGRTAGRRRIAVIAARGGGWLRIGGRSVQQFVEHAFCNQRYGFAPIVVRGQRLLDAAGCQSFSIFAEFAGHIEHGVAIRQNFAAQLRRGDKGVGLQAIIVGKLSAQRGGEQIVSVAMPFGEIDALGQGNALDKDFALSVV